jgi:hypothetical protein
MLQLCYASRAVRPFDSAQLADLLSRARANNESLGVTGLLLYDNQWFMQVLEGEYANVLQLYEKILRDRRHSEKLLVYKLDIEKPSFKNWSMGFLHVDRRAALQLPGYNNFFTKDFSPTAFRRDADRVREALLQFREGQWRRRVKVA